MSSRPVPADLLPWALAAVPAKPNQQPRMDVIAGDASNRRYFRLSLPEISYVVAEAPPATEKNPEFIAIRSLLEGAGVKVPALCGVDLERGYLLLEDLGDGVLLPLLNDKTVQGYYEKTFATLQLMAGAPISGGVLAAYDEVLLREEFSRFAAWFVDNLLGYQLGASEQSMLAALEQLLVASALEQPRVLVHRDFHSRNLMETADGQLAVIDFQDAVVGPITYDLVSLLKDCYIRWPPEAVEGWALGYRTALVNAQLMMAVDDATFLRWFDWMGLQRHIKVLGTFARLYLRDGKASYLADLPLVITYTLETLQKYSAGQPLFVEVYDWFQSQLSPLIAAQPWSVEQ